jgi:peroxin-5
LFHLSSNYDKAAECFQTAVHVRPHDARLWNKLGAALANDGQCEKAIDAYYHALTLSPGFVRARCNLGISCSNLRAYTQGIEHFLTALKQQNNGIGTHSKMSDHIWQRLHETIEYSQRTDLERHVIQRDLPKLLKEFHIE